MLVATGMECLLKCFMAWNRQLYYNTWHSWGMSEAVNFSYERKHFSLVWSLEGERERERDLQVLRWFLFQTYCSYKEDEYMKTHVNKTISRLCMLRNRDAILDRIVFRSLEAWWSYFMCSDAGTPHGMATVIAFWVELQWPVFYWHFE